MLRKKRKASLSLSINAIVVLILAITMLGLGLGFIRGMFGKISTQVQEQIANEPEPTIPSASIPITLSRESIVTHAKETEVLKVGFYNPTEITFDGMPSASCTGLTITTSANSKRIEQGKADTFNMLIPIPNDAQPKKYLCQVEISIGGSGDNGAFEYFKDFTVEVIR